MEKGKNFFLFVMFGWVCECGFDSYPMRPWNLCTGNDGLKTVVPLIYTQH